MQEIVQTLIETYGLLGLFVGAIIGNASVFLPLPIDIIVFAIGATAQAFWTPCVIGFVAGVGAAIGEMTSYLIGLMGINAIEKYQKKELEHLYEIKEKLKRKGMLFVFLGAFTPFPFDLVGIAAGLIKYNPYYFFTASVAGKVTRTIILAYAGFYGLYAIKMIFAI